MSGKLRGTSRNGCTGEDLARPLSAARSSRGGGQRDAAGGEDAVGIEALLQRARDREWDPRATPRAADRALELWCAALDDQSTVRGLEVRAHAGERLGTARAEEKCDAVTGIDHRAREIEALRRRVPAGPTGPCDLVHHRRERRDRLPDPP